MRWTRIAIPPIPTSGGRPVSIPLDQVGHNRGESAGRSDVCSPPWTVEQRRLAPVDGTDTARGIGGAVDDGIRRQGVPLRVHTAIEDLDWGFAKSRVGQRY